MPPTDHNLTELFEASGNAVTFDSGNSDDGHLGKNDKLTIDWISFSKKTYTFSY